MVISFQVSGAVGTFTAGRYVVSDPVRQHITKYSQDIYKTVGRTGVMDCALQQPGNSYLPRQGRLGVAGLRISELCVWLVSLACKLII